MYVGWMFSLFQLRRKEPDLKRPYKAVCYPVFPIIALVGSTVCFVLMVVYNFHVFIAYMILVALCYLFFLRNRTHIREVHIDEIEGK